MREATRTALADVHEPVAVTTLHGPLHRQGQLDVPILPPRDEQTVTITLQPSSCTLTLTQHITTLTMGLAASAASAASAGAQSARGSASEKTFAAASKTRRNGKACSSGCCARYIAQASSNSFRHVVILLLLLCCQVQDESQARAAKTPWRPNAKTSETLTLRTTPTLAGGTLTLRPRTLAHCRGGARLVRHHGGRSPCARSAACVRSCGVLLL